MNITIEDSLTVIDIKKEDIAEDVIRSVRTSGKYLTDVLIECGVKSKNEGRNLIKNGGLRVNTKKIVDEHSVIYYISDMKRFVIVQFI